MYKPLMADMRDVNLFACCEIPKLTAPLALTIVLSEYSILNIKLRIDVQ